MILLEVVFLLVFWSWTFTAVLFLRNTILPRTPVGPVPVVGELPLTLVQFPATDGVRLEGWEIAGDRHHPWVILCHGLGSNRADLLEIAHGLHGAGLNLLLFDFRAHGGSAGRTTSFGWLEQRDLEGALAYLGRQPDVPAVPYGVYGISMGGSVALMVAAQDERIGAVAVDSPYTDLESTLWHHLRLMYPLPQTPFLWYVLATYRLRFGIWPRDVSPLQSIATISPRPLFLIHGASDPRMPVEGTQAMFERATQPKQRWIVQDAGHLEAYAVDPQTYMQRLAQFFTSSLR